MTTAASVACGIRPMSGASNSIVAQRGAGGDERRQLRASAGQCG